ncbi:MAG: hypothetical protein JNN15_06385 [Blastocatellia bacterium]|nr:hypothetical protein [Blastocatellia bacterium]
MSKSVWEEKDSIKLFRQLIAHEEWNIAVVSDEDVDDDEMPSILFEEDDKGKKSISIFSKEKKNDEEINFLKLKGETLFKFDFSGIDYIYVDPESESSVRISQDMFNALGSVAEAVEVEQCLEKVHQGDESEEILEIIRDHQEYYIGIVQVDKDSYSLTGPADEKKKDFVAVFTCFDCFETYGKWFEKSNKEQELLMTIMNGQQLFENLSKMAIEGIIFNCLGPVKSLEFPNSFIKMLKA